MLEQNVPNPLAKNPNFHTHKVFAAVGIILIAMVIICGGVWYFVQSAEDKAGTVNDNTAIKTSTSSAKTSTFSATKDETSGWKTFTFTNKTKNYSFKYPDNWSLKKVFDDDQDVQYTLTKGFLNIEFFNQARGAQISGPNLIMGKEVNIKFNGETIKTQERGSTSEELWEIANLDGNKDFSFSIFSTKKTTQEDKNLMLKIVETFQTL